MALLFFPPILGKIIFEIFAGYARAIVAVRFILMTGSFWFIRLDPTFGRCQNENSSPIRNFREPPGNRITLLFQLKHWTVPDISLDTLLNFN